jgi:hypothetical protein
VGSLYAVCISWSFRSSLDRSRLSVRGAGLGLAAFCRNELRWLLLLTDGFGRVLRLIPNDDGSTSFEKPGAQFR